VSAHSVNPLPFGPLDGRTVHLCIDMQRLFLEPGPWYAPAGLEILPAIRRLLGHAPAQVIFTRFITARNPSSAKGSWARYYRRWHEVTRDALGEGALDLHPDLAPFATDDRAFDKATHDAFDDGAFARHIDTLGPSALILSGVETDVCVLATAMSAVDLGYRTVIATDAVASSVEESHRACLDYVYPRFDQQIELATVDEVLAAWSPS
jgi:nicotinamidase-related amidase